MIKETLPTLSTHVRTVYIHKSCFKQLALTKPLVDYGRFLGTAFFFNLEFFKTCWYRKNIR